MQVQQGDLQGSLIIEPKVFGDPRGLFFESYHLHRYREIGVKLEFVQDNHTRSSKHALRGLHYQLKHPQGKLVWVVKGEIFDVGVDLRRNSPTFGQWQGVHLSDSNRLQFYLPPGTAHGLVVLSEVAEISYKCTDGYYPDDEIVLRWDDQSVGIQWPVENPVLSQRDQQGKEFTNVPYFSNENVG